MESQSETSQTVSALKLPVLKTGEYDQWSMRMEQYLTFTDYALWEGLQNLKAMRKSIEDLWIIRVHSIYNNNAYLTMCRSYLHAAVESLQAVETLHWENILTVGSSSNSGNHLTNSGNPLAFYSQQSSPKLDTSPSYQVSRIK
ncbi:hypothetical protein Tco_0934844 [Tanacetum coccineum]